MQDLMTPVQVADYLQMTPDTVYRLIHQKKLAATQIGRAYRIPKEDLEDFLTANSNRPLVKEALFRRFMKIAERNPGLNSDDVLEELEKMDEEKKQAKSKKA